MDKIVDSYNQIFGNKKRIMVVFGHPDDLETYCGGTIARLIKDGKIIRSIKMTNGQSGSRQEKITSGELGKLRETEDREAMKILGISEENNIYLGLQDGQVDNSNETIGKIVYQIREFKPDLIITHNPENVIIRFDKDVNWINHKDHRNTGKSTVDAAFPYSRDLLFFPDQFSDPKISSRTVTEFIFMDYYDGPDLAYVDVTDFIDIRVQAHAKHSSQYTLEHAQDAADFFTKLPQFPPGKRFERFRYVITD